MGRASRDKGARFEREVVNRLKERHMDALRVPLSGAAAGFKDDVLVHVHWQKEPLRLECKKRATGFRQIYDWLGESDALVIAADRKPTLVVIDLELFIDLIQ